MGELYELTARAAVDGLRNGRFSPLELIDAAEARIAATDDAVNALPTLCFDRARAAAQTLMAAGPPDDPPPGYLYGLPISVKDLADVAGVRSTKGSPIFADHVPTRSDLQVERLERNGAVVVAKSNTPEFGAGAQTFNEVFGATRNPWNTDKTCGGSSGGAAVSLATGQVALATGSDLGGSLRIPASFCSVVGFRPGPGRIATGPGSAPFNPLPVAGPMARNVGDVALMLDAMVGFDPHDPSSLPAPADPFQNAANAPAAPPRIAFSPDLGVAPVAPEIAAICAGAAARFAELGAAVDEAAPDLGDARDIFQVLRAAGFAASYGDLMKTHRRQMKPEVIWNTEKGLAQSADEVARAWHAQAALSHRVADFFQTFDLLVCPTVTVPPFDVDQRYLSRVGDTEYDNYIDWLIITFVITVTTCPAVSVPCGFTADGLPVGLQLVAPHRDEAGLLRAAAAFEALIDLPAAPIDPRRPNA